MLRVCSWFACLVLTLSVVGCNDDASSAPAGGAAGGQPIGTVAIIDLAEVAKALGRADEITKAIQDRQTELAANLNGLKTRLRSDINEQAKALGAVPTNDQKKEMVKLQMEAQKRIQDAAGNAARKVTELQNELMQAFRKETGPVAMKIAKSKGIGVVMIQSPSILAFDKGADITREVIAAMQAEQ